MKKGDICSKSGSVFIFSRYLTDGSYRAFCGIPANKEDGFIADECDWGVVETFNPIKHATEEEKQRLFDIMNMHGYKWNSEKFELIEISEMEMNEKRRFVLKGDSKRGSEVIDTLKMLGGENCIGYDGKKETQAYYIGGGNTIYSLPYIPSNAMSIQDFENEYPFKVGDNVMYNASLLGYLFVHSEIKCITWDGFEIIYTMTNGDKVKVNDIIYENAIKKENMEQVINVKDLISEKGELVISDDYTFQVDGNRITVCKKTNKYPITMLDCILALDKEFSYEDVLTKIEGWKGDDLENIQTLSICRDAYWKLADNYQPNWEDDSVKYCIHYSGGKITKENVIYSHRFLAFPTEEMRDKFCENFPNLIENCKEFI